MNREAAEAADRADRLAFACGRFALPPGLTYLDGNSLGALASNVADVVADAVSRQWGHDLVTSWNENDWWTLPRRIGDRIGALVGAAPGQVICGDSTSVQLFQALTAAARLRPGRTELITDGAGFPTDQYIADSVARLLGLTVRRISPPDLAAILTEPEPEPEPEPETGGAPGLGGGPDGRGAVAVLALSAVDYRTGELWDVEGITAAAHRAGAIVVWDLSHAGGALPTNLDGIGADLAVGCSYKYLNGGPGAPAWIYLAARHQHDVELPLTGWHGHRDPFALEAAYAPAAGIERARIGTPPLLSMLALEAALDVWTGVDLADVRTKSLELTSLVIDFADAHLPGVQVVTPREPGRRGSQVSLRTPHAYELCQALVARGVIGDFRAPDLLRLGLTPLYLSHVQVWDAMEVLRGVLESKAYLDPAYARSSAAVT
jgi:kynureninase